MKMSKEKLKRIALVVLMVAFAVLEFGLKAKKYGGRSGSIFTVLILLAIFGLLRDIRRATKTGQEDGEEEQPLDPSKAVTYATMDATGTALGGLDWMLRKINPDYDPDAERNTRKVDSAALARLDEMKSAGLIDEAEYQRRKKELAEQ